MIEITFILNFLQIRKTDKNGPKSKQEPDSRIARLVLPLINKKKQLYPLISGSLYVYTSTNTAISFLLLEE